jgi:small subunit ribosomal protein S6
LRHYQSVLILKPDLDEGHVDQAIEKITGHLSKSGGDVVLQEKWGKKRLAYRVKKSKFGYYLNLYHTCEPAKLVDFEKELQLNDQVIKYLIVKLEQKDLDRILNAKKESEEKSESESESESKPTEAPAAPTTPAAE